LGYFIFSRNHTEPPKVAQLAKKLSNLVTLEPLDRQNIRRQTFKPTSTLDGATTFSKATVSINPFGIAKVSVVGLIECFLECRYELSVALLFFILQPVLKKYYDYK
jgi:hypothetical protein